MIFRAVFMTAAALTLAACGASYDVDGTRSLPNKGADFHRALQADYIDLAAAEKAEADWSDTKTFVQRARRAANGETFLPEAINARDLPQYSVATLSDAHQRLMAVLNDKTRADLPVMAAMAQSGFECWMQEQEEDRQPEHIAACRSSFNTALRALEAAAPETAPSFPAPPKADPAMPDQFRVFFDFDSAYLNPEAKQIVDQISAAHDRYNPATVLVVGHTDSIGPSDYNIMLSQRRAESVYSALAERGIPQNDMRVEAYGEERPAGPEARWNRRVDVFFEK